MTKLCLISDTHSMHRKFEIPECDILIHAGDFGNIGEVEIFEDFVAWLKEQPAKHIVFIAGNHDKTHDPNLAGKLAKQQKFLSAMVQKKGEARINDILENLPENIHYLEDNFIVLEGFKIYGTPYSPTFGIGWAFNKDRGSDIAQQWAKIPKDTDILITHTPPFGILDVIPEEYIRVGETANVGCKDLLEAVKHLPNLQLNVFGHIHSNFGYITKKITNKKTMAFCNAAVLDNSYKPLTRYPIIVNI